MQQPERFLCGNRKFGRQQIAALDYKSVTL
jgi:hypothetical protein